MKLTFSDITAITCGAEYLSEEAEGILFHRFTAEEERCALANMSDIYNIQVPSAADIRLAFRTDARRLKIAYACRYNGNKVPNCGRIDVLVDGNLRAHLGRDAENFNGEDSLTLPDGEKLVELYLPYTKHFYLREFELDSGFMPVRRPLSMINYGDSITHGYDAEYPSKIYTAILARLCGADNCNKGVGGGRFDPVMLEPEEPMRPDIVTVAFGTNDWCHKSRAELAADCREYFRRLAAKFPATKIFAITPIWRADAQADMPFGAPAWEIGDVITEQTADFSNVIVIPGWELVGHDPGLFNDRVLHPNDIGFADYGPRLYDAMKEYL